VKIHTVFISYNRLDLTKEAIQSYLATVTVPYSYIVVDNGSSDGTQDWLAQSEHPCMLLGENFYPGYACNRGWETAPADADFLHRADNDFTFLPGWCDAVASRFHSSKVGQVGLRTGDEELGAQFNVGGNCVIRRTLWDQGLRYDESPWPEYPPGYSEDSYFSPAVREMGYHWTRVKVPCIVSLASGDLNDPYYQESYGARRIVIASSDDE
jgi:glycosyltransferase involved in cell wall biosynthesis